MQSPLPSAESETAAGFIMESRDRPGIVRPGRFSLAGLTFPGAGALGCPGMDDQPLSPAALGQKQRLCRKMNASFDRMRKLETIPQKRYEEPFSRRWKKHRQDVIRCMRHLEKLGGWAWVPLESMTAPAPEHREPSYS